MMLEKNLKSSKFLNQRKKKLVPYRLLGDDMDKKLKSTSQFIFCKHIPKDCFYKFLHPRLLTEGVYLKPFIVATILMFLQQFCGVNAVIFYAEIIFIKAGSSIEPGSM